MQLNSIPKSSVGKRLKFRNVKGIHYIYHKTYSSYLEGQVEVDKIKLAGRKAIVYNYYRKRSFIVYIEATIKELD